MALSEMMHSRRQARESLSSGLLFVAMVKVLNERSEGGEVGAKSMGIVKLRKWFELQWRRRTIPRMALSYPGIGGGILRVPDAD